MIATNEAVDILRHGWQDAASTLAADVPEVAELLQARLEMAVASEHLDERHLLDTIQEVESVTARAGSPSAPDLARRLRRTVYEYLLALDAARPLETAPTRVDQPARALGSPMVGAEEVAALGHASRSRDDAAAEAADAAPDGAIPATRRRFGLRRRQRRPADAGPELSHAPEADAEAVPGPDGPDDTGGADAAEPDWRFAIAAEPALFDGGLIEARDGGSEAHDEQEPSNGASIPPDGEPSQETQAGAVADLQTDEAAGELVTTFVAPRAGFHIVEDAPPHRVDQEEPRLHMPAFTADEEAHRDPEHAEGAAQEPETPTADPAHEAEAGAGTPDFASGEPDRVEQATTGFAAEASTDPEVAAFALAPAEPGPPEAGSDFLAWRHPDIAAGHPAMTPPPPSPPPVHTPSPEGFTPGAAVDAAEPPPLVGPYPAPAPAPAAPDDETDSEPRGWGVRRNGEAHGPRRGASGNSGTPAQDDPFENNTRLADMRRRIEERLRRKRCDEAAALLQEIAQETGGRAVAELAMNAGDRCRALGKSNAALNCYLAAARADPVYELPLSRLADVCIDNQDIELAVSYLERIARIYRFREDDNAALRTYRRIATIAPYREDVLTLLMNAQRTGQLR